ncbi:FecR family protein [Mucilaginibacter gracilis]|uniref:FecR family protein n=1 Tax=Mucilaginibacter gracilis TaxID=423350 RepID=A0A495J483_9SPHI|nr:FecR domain-containing protein [Mucilaginibacter gracilis]RKR83402.1 FecR family protein [Mucilaginibacter gracilis]
MPTEKELKKLLEKYASGKCSPAETKLLEAWFTRIGENQEVEDLSSADQHRMLNSLRKSPRFAKGKNRIISMFPAWKKIAVAASMVGILVLSGLWINKSIRNSGQQETAYIQISTGKGEVRKVTLPDRSVVWLNARTKLSYSPDFKNNRSLRLNGEAVFQVTHDKTHPFKVQTQDSIETTVLGTQFDISSYDGLTETQVAVLEGRVKVGKISQQAQGVLVKNDMISFNRSTKTFDKRIENAETMASWRTGQWELRGRGVEGLALVLFNQYGITLKHTKKSLDKVEVSANFNKRQTAEEIISTFCLLGDCKFRWISKTEVELY